MAVISGTGTGTINLTEYTPFPSRILSFSLVNKSGGSITATIYVVDDANNCVNYTFTYVNNPDGNTTFVYTTCAGVQEIEQITGGTLTKCARQGTAIIASGSGTITEGSSCSSSYAITSVNMTLGVGQAYIRDSPIEIKAGSNIRIVTSGSVDYYFTFDVPFSTFFKNNL